jgi:hypothetical protein
MGQNALPWRRFWRAETGIFLGVWLALLLLGRSTLLRDPGAFWHVKAGQEMLSSGQVIQADPFSFTRYNRPWVAQQWLAECGMAAVHALSGFDGLLLASATLLAGLYTWIASRLLRAGWHVLPAGLLLALVLAASSHQFHIRPLILTIALLGATFALLVDVEAGRKRLSRLWWFVPLMIVWANLHAGVLTGIGTLALVLLGWAVAWLWGKDSPVRQPHDLIALAALMLVCGVSVLANPYGLDLPRAWLRTLAIPLPRLIQEHRPLDLTDPLGWTTALLGLGYLVALWGLWPKWPRVTWLIPLVWLVLAAGRVRNVPLFAVTTAIAAAEVLPATRWADWLRRREMLLPDRRKEPTQPRGHGWPAALLPILLVLTAMLLQLAGVRVPVVGRGWARLDPTRWPVELLPELERINRTSPEGTRIFNDLNFGGLLIYYAPRLRVFVDDRCALYGGEFLQQYDEARRNDPSQIDRWQQQYGFRYALVETDTPFDRYLERSGDWGVVRRTPVAALYRHHLGFRASIK